MSVAIDLQRKVVWAYAPSRLYAFNYDGVPLFDTPVAETGSPADLVVNTHDGSVWLGLGTKLIQFSAAGQRLGSLSLASSLVKLAMTQPATLWVATASKVTAYDPISGSQLSQINDLGNSAKVKDIDGFDSTLWVGLSKSLRRYFVTTPGAAIFDQTWSVPNLQFVDESVPGSTAEVVMTDDSLKILAGGIVQTGIDPFPGTEASVAVVQDSIGSWHISDQGRLRRFEAIETPFIALPSGLVLRDIAIVPHETRGPGIGFAFPVYRGWTPRRPTFSMFYQDSDSGVDPATLVVAGSIAGTIWKASCTAGPATAECTAPVVFPAGQAIAQASIKDHAGNEGQNSVTFQVDPTPPSLQLQSPAAGTALFETRPPLEFTHQDQDSGIATGSLKLKVNGADVPMECTFATNQASCRPSTDLPVGLVNLSATIADLAGNVSAPAQASVTITAGVDATPPSLSFSMPVAGSAVTATRPQLLLLWSDAQSGVDPSTLRIERNGVALTADCAVSATQADCAPVLPLPIGPVSLTATVKDRSGNVSAPAAVAFTVVRLGEYSLTGRVEDESGDPLAGADVWVVGDLSKRAVSDASGEFAIEVRGPAERSVAVNARLGRGAGSRSGGSAVVEVTGPAIDVGTVVLRSPCPSTFTEALGTALPPGRYVDAMVTFDDGTGPALYVSGSFDSIGGVPARRIAKWDGVRWSALGAGLDVGANAMAVFDDGSGPALFVTGGFQASAGSPGNYVAKWDGVRWSSLGNGLNGKGWAMTVFDDGSGPALYVAGQFSNAGGVAVSGLASWDGASWSAIPGWSVPTPQALAVFDAGTGPELIVGGQFLAGPGRSQGIASWNGSRWSPLGVGLDGQALALTVFDAGDGDRLYVGGNFNNAGGQPASKIASWDGSHWSPLGSGFVESVFTLASFDDGTGPALYAGGFFSGGVARWDTRDWRLLGGGVNASVNAIAAVPAREGGRVATLVLGGDFGSAGGVVSQALASWESSCTPPDTEAPLIQLTSPASPVVTTASATLTVAGSISESGTLTVNGQNVAVSSAHTFSHGPLTLANGLNVFDLVATDTHGNKRSLRVQAFRDQGIPALQIIAPSAGSTATTARPELELVYRDDAGIDSSSISMLRNGAAMGVECRADGLRAVCTPVAPLPTGSVTVSATVRDLAGNISNAAQVSFNIDPSLALSPTTVRGVVQLVGGSPGTGAVVQVLDMSGATATVDAAGSFTVAGVSLKAGQLLTIVATLRNQNGVLRGVRSALAPVPGGITNAGTIILRPLCAQRFDDAYRPAVGVDGYYPDEGNGGIDNEYRYPQVSAMAVFDDGTGPALYVGGQFQVAGGVSANNIARWNGKEWSQVGGAFGDGGGTNGWVEAMLVWNGELYVAGGFTVAGGLPVRRLAKWNGSAWSDVGSGVTGLTENRVSALAVYNNELYVGGEFAMVGPNGSTVNAANVARWNGAAWSALGSGTDRPVYSLYVHGTSKKELYVGGTFLKAGGSTVNHIAKWSGNSWSALSGGVGPISGTYAYTIGVYSMTSYQGSLVVGGFFGSTGPTSDTGYEGIARWDGRRWTKLGGGLDVIGTTLFDKMGVQALGVFDDGGGQALYASGAIQVAGDSTTLAGVVRWNGTQWSPVGSGVPFTGYGGTALATYDADLTDARPAKLFAGFNSRGLGPDKLGVNAIAAWDGSTWSALGSGPSHYVHGIASASGPAGPALYLAGNHTVSPLRSSGSGFERLPVVDGRVTAMEELPMPSGPELFIGGPFSHAGPWAVNNVAHWSGKQWEPMGEGFELYDEINDFEVHDDGSGPSLYAAGTFKRSGGRPVLAVGRFDGHDWQPVGTGVGNAAWGEVNALASATLAGRTALYAGGSFDQAGGLLTPNLVAWDGSSWSSVGGGTNGEVEALAVFTEPNGPKLFVAGSFTKAGGQTIPYLARWDGTSWSTVGAGLNGPVSKLAVFDDGNGPALYAYGSFGASGNLLVKSIAKWDGLRWSSVGSDLGPFPYHSITGAPRRALFGYPDDVRPALYVGGEFTRGSKFDEPIYIGRIIRPLECGLDDTVKPSISFTAPVSGGWVRSSTPTLTLSYSDDRSGIDPASLVLKQGSQVVAASCEMGAFTASCLPTQALPEGSVTLQATIKDSAGNVSTAAAINFQIDVTAPSLAFSSPAPSGWAVSRPVLKLAYADARSGIDMSRLSLTVDGRSTAFQCVGTSSSATCTASSELPDGNAVARATILDLAGNPSNEATVSFVIESTLPAFGLIAPAAGAALNTPRPSIQVSYSDSPAGVDTASLALKANGAAFGTQCTFGPAIASCLPASDLPQGVVLLSGSIRDKAGNESVAPQRSFTIDSVAPQIQVQLPVSGTLTAVAAQTVTGTVSEPATVFVNGAVATVLPSLTFAYGPVTLAEGLNTLHIAATDAAGNAAATDIDVRLDTVAPTLTFTSPTPNAACPASGQTIQLGWSDGGSGVDESSLVLRANGQAVATTCQFSQTGASCQLPSLPSANLTLAASVRDRAGNASAASVACTADPASLPPTINVSYPVNGTAVSYSPISIRGSISRPATLSVNGQSVFVDTDLSFIAGPFALVAGQNAFSLVAVDTGGRTGQQTLAVSLDTTSPGPVNMQSVSLVEEAPGREQLSGAPGAVTSPEPGMSVVVEKVGTREHVLLDVQTNGGFGGPITAFGGDTVRLTVRDAAGNQSEPRDLRVAGSSPIPPDPATIAPPLDSSVSVDACELVSFFWSGVTPIQYGLTAGAVDCDRVAVVRGRVLDATGAPLAGVRIDAQTSPELGATFSQVDGRFDLAVHATGFVVVRMFKEGHFPSQRTLSLRPQQFETLDDVVLVRPDGAVTIVDTSVGASAQVVRGSSVTDDDGVRTGTLYFPAGTTAAMKSGTATEPLTSPAVRITEYSVGEHGRERLPATLGLDMSYGYVVSLSVDGLDENAAHVEFSQPVSFLVEDFLGWPVGQRVRAGYYEQSQATWVPDGEARLVQVVGVANGLADLDVSGSGDTAGGLELSALGITESERQQIASLYPVGQRLLRAQLTHFSDHVFAPAEPWLSIPVPSTNPPFVMQDRNLDQPGIVPYAGIVETENQVLGEALPIAGTGFSMHYRSDRVPGRTAPYSLRIPLIGSTVPQGISRIELTIDIAGQHETRSYTPTPNLSDTFVWNRQEGYGRQVQGAAFWTASITYFAGSGRGEVRARKTYGGSLGTLDAAGAAGLGGWTLGLHHFYDAATGTLYYGDGRRRDLRSTLNQPRVLERVAGTGEAGSSGDGGAARRARLSFPVGLSVTRDGGLLIADHGSCRIRKILKDGVITTVAGRICGDGQAGAGDGGPAIEAELSGPAKAVEGRDGSIYIADYHGQRIRRVDLDGKIWTVAGNGEPGCTGNQVSFPNDLAVAEDGSILVVNKGQSAGTHDICESIERIDARGNLETVVATDFQPDGPFPSHLNQPEGVAVGPDGSVYFTPVNAVARRPVGGGPDPQHPSWVIGGLLRYYGANELMYAGDGLRTSGFATRFFRTGHLAVGPDGTVYVADRLNQRIRSIGPSEIVNTLVGGGDLIPTGDGLHATAAALQDPTGLAVDPTGRYLYFSDGPLRQVWRARLPEAKAAAEQVVPEPDGSVRYVFDEEGRHLRTEDAVSGRVLWRFTYADFSQPSGEKRHLPITVQDQFQNVTTIERNGNGDATAMVAPFGQRTSLTIDNATGYLARVAFAGLTVETTHDTGGLLRSIVDPRRSTYTFNYDTEGRLSQVADPAEGQLDFDHQDLPSGWTVSQQTGLGRISSSQTLEPSSDPDVPSPVAPDELLVRRTTDTAGFTSELHEFKDGTFISRSPDGMVTTATLMPDPLLGELAPYVRQISVQTPSGLRKTTTEDLSKAPEAEGSLNAAAVFSDVSTNGRASHAEYQAGARRVTSSSASGKTSLSLLDSLGRVTETSVPNLEPVRTIYDSRGRVTQVAQGPAGAERASVSTYDGQGYLETLTDPLQRTVRFEHDAAGRVTKQILPDLREIQFAYDDNGNLTSLTPPSRPSHDFSYTPVDQLDAYAPPDVNAGDDATHYAYNGDHQVELITRPDGLTIDPSYDTAGRLTAVTTPTGTTGYNFSPLTGQLSSVTAPGGGSISYQYDGALVTRIAQGEVVPATVDYVYDRQPDGTSNFWVASRSVNGAAATKVDYQYDPDGLVTNAGPLQFHRDASNGLLRGTTLLNTSDVYERNSFGEVTRYQSGFNDGSCSPTAPPFAGCRVALDQTFVRDAVGRIREKTETLRNPVTLASETHAYAYTYDPAGRLTEVKRDGSVWESYTYDGNSNRVGWTDPWSSGTATYDAQDRLLTYGDTTYTYTANGELRTKTQGSATVTYDYDVYGNLRHVTLADGTQIEYLIDAANRRIGKKVNGTLVQGFLYGDGIAPIAETDGSGAVVSTFIYGTHVNVPDVMVRGGVTYRLVTDHLGSVRWVINAQTGEVAQRVDYDAFGRVVLDTAGGWQPFGFAGGMWDTRIALVRYGARDYSPDVARWTSKDPVRFGGDDPNLYGYALVDPVNMTDPSGLLGLADLPNIPQEVTDFYAGIGDTMLLGFGDELRNAAGIEGVDRCSKAYSNGEWAGIAASTVFGAAQGAEAAGTKTIGNEFSHWIADRVLKRTGSRWIRNVFGRSILNGNYVTPYRHFLHDPYRFISGWENLRRLPSLLRQLDRLPRILVGTAGGAAISGTAAATNEAPCR